VVFLFTPSITKAANWYVDNAVVANGNGQSWNTAWKSFSSIVWGANGVKAGDTLYISGGSTSKTYTSALTIGASGSVGNPITIKIEQDSGHNGKAVITVSDNNGITISNHSHITISGQAGSDTTPKIQLTRNYYSGVEIAGTSDNIIVEYVEIDNNDMVVSSAIGGLNIASSLNPGPSNIELRYLIVHDNQDDQFHFVQNTVYEPTGYDKIRIHNCEIYNQHDDGVESWIGGVSFYNNRMRDRISPYRGHPDMMQLYNTYYKVYNNIFENHYGDTPESDGGTGGQIMVLYFELDGGDNDEITWNNRIGNLQIYNNVFYEPNEFQVNTLYVAQISLAVSDPDFTSVGNIYVFNNTFSGASTNNALALSFSGSPNHAVVHDIYIENNNFYNASYVSSSVALDRGDGSDITYGSVGDAADVIFDYNAFYGSGASNIYYGGAQLAYANFKATSGCQDHEVTTNPNLSASNYFQQGSGSSLNESGFSQSSYFSTDKLGTTRPQGSAWDIGAYEYNSGQTTCTPGDANSDGNINISDVQTCINVILETDTDQSHKTCSDMNGDTNVNIADCQAIINKILNP